MSPKSKYRRLNRIISAFESIEAIEIERERKATSDIQKTLRKILDHDKNYEKIFEMQSINSISWFNERKRLQQYVISLNEIVDEAREKSCTLKKSKELMVSQRDKICYSMNEASMMNDMIEYITGSNSSSRKGTGKFPGIKRKKSN